MPDDVSDILEYYNSILEVEQVRLDRHQLEHDLTWRYLDQYLPAQGTIMEVGAATGRYTLGLARRGYRLTAVDMSAELLGRCRKNLIDAGLASAVQFVVADARDLSSVPEKLFDAVLMMGPLYHLVEEADRRLALAGVFNRLRPGGIIFSAFISRFGVIGDVIKTDPAWVEDQAQTRAHFEQGKRPDGAPRGGFRGYFARVSEIAPLHEAVGFETITVAGVEPAIATNDEIYNKLEGRQRQLWLDLMYEISTEPSIIGASRHLLYVGKKT